MVSKAPVRQEEVQMEFNSPAPVELIAPTQVQQTATVAPPTDNLYIERVKEHMKQRISIARRDPASQQKKKGRY